MRWPVSTGDHIGEDLLAVTEKDDTVRICNADILLAYRASGPAPAGFFLASLVVFASHQSTPL